ncbi:MAG: hypothetical protein AAB539_02000 [Patescibacteria group bacterium]
MSVVAEKVDLYDVVRIVAYKDDKSQTFKVYLYAGPTDEESVIGPLQFPGEIGLWGFVHGIRQIAAKKCAVEGKGTKVMIFRFA